jgi:hypothetical protein
MCGSYNQQTSQLNYYISSPRIHIFIRTVDWACCFVANCTPTSFKEKHNVTLLKIIVVIMICSAINSNDLNTNDELWQNEQEEIIKFIKSQRLRSAVHVMKMCKLCAVTAASGQRLRSTEFSICLQLHTRKERENSERALSETQYLPGYLSSKYSLHLWTSLFKQDKICLTL